MKRLIITESQLKVIKEHILEDIDPSDAYRNPESLQTVINGNRCVGFIATLYDSLEDYIKKATEAGLKIIMVDQPLRGKKAIIFYRSGCEDKAQQLFNIARKNNGFLPINTPEETYEIGILLGYNQQKVKEFVMDKFPSYKFY